MAQIGAAFIAAIVLSTYLVQALIYVFAAVFLLAILAAPWIGYLWLRVTAPDKARAWMREIDAGVERLRRRP